MGDEQEGLVARHFSKQSAIRRPTSNPERIETGLRPVRIRSQTTAKKRFSLVLSCKSGLILSDR